jgi:hypothetical protein
MNIAQQRRFWPADSIDPDPPFVAASKTSRAAAEQIRPVSSIARKRVYDAILASGERGLTDAEICKLTGLAGDTARPRRRELVKGGFVRDSGRERPSPSGRRMQVWICTAKRYEQGGGHHGG